jgi:hypothetical protein
MRLSVLIAIASSLLGCAPPPAYPDRADSPESAFEQAKLALDVKDMHGYVDAISDAAVLDLLRNALFLCFAHTDASVVPSPRVSPGCERVVEEHGFPLRNVALIRASDEHFLSAVEKVGDLRSFAAKLESHNRASGGGTSFVWGHLNAVAISKPRVEGLRAFAQATSPYGEHPIEFRLGETGWRVDMFPMTRSEAFTSWRE